MLYRLIVAVVGLILLSSPAFAAGGLGVDKIEAARMFGAMGVDLGERIDGENGEYRWIGKTDAAISEAIGEFDDLRSVSLVVIVVGDKQAQILAAGRSLAFIKWAMPNWTSDQAQAWFAEMVDGGEKITAENGRKLKGQVIPSMGMITLSISPE